MSLTYDSDFQIFLHSHAVWSESLFSIQFKFSQNPVFSIVNGEDLGQTTQIFPVHKWFNP